MPGSATRIPLEMPGRLGGRRTLLALATIWIVVCTTLPVLGMTPAENAKVEHLLRYIGGLKGCAFVRNGKEYDAAAAEKHLRMKFGKAEGRLRDARDFVEKCASQSLMSGEPYRIRLADGTLHPCRDILLRELARYEKAQAGPYP